MNLYENCDKHIKKAKFGISFLVSIGIIAGSKKTGLIDNLFGNELDYIFIIYMMCAGVFSLVLITPYTTCFFKPKN